MRGSQELGTPPDIRTTFLFHPPVGDAASWQMTVEGFVHVLTTSFSEAFTKYRASHLRDKTVVDFEVEVGPGVWVEGVANTPVEGSAVITLVGVSASEAAQFALWLRTSMVPTPGLVRFSSERALEGGDATEWAVPSGGDLQQIVSVLEGHVARFHGH